MSRVTIPSPIERHIEQCCPRSYMAALLQNKLFTKHTIWCVGPHTVPYFSSWSWPPILFKSRAHLSSSQLGEAPLSSWLMRRATSSPMGDDDDDAAGGACDWLGGWRALGVGGAPAGMKNTSSLSLRACMSNQNGSSHTFIMLSHFDT